MCIDAIDVMCKEWGRQMRRAFGSDAGAWPRNNILARVRELQDGAGYSTGPRQHFAEVLTNDALQVRVAMQGLSLPIATTVRVHYFAKASVKLKLPVVEQLIERRLSTRDYWQNIDRAHHWILARLPPAE